MMNRFSVCFLLVIALLSCKTKKKKQENYFSILPFLQGQVKQMDSSTARILLIHQTGEVSDTTTINRKDFRTYAADFLSLPDITGDKKDDYDESVIFDEATNSILLNYTTNDPDEEVRREAIVLKAVDDEGKAMKNGEVESIVVDWFHENDDSTVIKNMLWQVNREFQVITKTTLTNQPEKIRMMRVVWE